MAETRILSNFRLFFQRSAHHKGRHEHDPSGGNNNKIVGLDFEILVIEIRQAKAESPIEALGFCAFLDGADYFPGLKASQCPALVDQLSEHPIAFLFELFLGNHIGSQ